MKQANTAKKLALKKSTVANLSKEQMNKVYGGTSTEVVVTVVIGIAAWAFNEGVNDGRTNR